MEEDFQSFERAFLSLTFRIDQDTGLLGGQAKTYKSRWGSCTGRGPDTGRNGAVR